MRTVKQQINPMVAAGIAALVLLVAGFFLWRGTGTGAVASDKPTGPPAEFSERLSGMKGGGGAPNVPSGQGSAPANAPAPASGNASGYMAPPSGR